MTILQQKSAQHQTEFDGLIATWNGLSSTQRCKEWSRYLDLTDEGGAGWHRFARLLINSFCEGWCPLGGVGRNAEGDLGPAHPKAA